MNVHDNGNEVKCTMCYFTCLSQNDLIAHIVRYHRHDPRFSVTCTKHGCGATYGKWNSFHQHLYRKHHLTSAVIESHTQIQEEPDVDFSNIRVDVEELQQLSHESHEPSTEYIKWFAAKFFLNVRENCKVSQNSMNIIIDGVQSLLKIYSSLIINECKNMKDPETQLYHFEDLNRVYNEIHPPEMIFSFVNSPDSLDKFLIDKMLMVPPVEIKISSHLGWKKKKGNSEQTALREIHNCGYIVPFMANLKNLLLNDTIRHNIENPMEHQNGLFRTVLDGSYYRENLIFHENENSLAIIVYYDDLGITNPSSSSAKVQKLSMFYWVLGNIKPELRSSQNAIQLLAIIKTKYLKESGAFEKILQPFIDDIKKLQTEGIDIVVNNSTKNFKGSLLFSAGDTPASAFIGGFKESVAANHPCRTCMISKEDLSKYFRESDLILRNSNVHNDHLDVIEESSLTKAAKQFWQKTYGVNSRSSLMQIPHFNVTNCFPQDCMHILIEGVTEITCRLFLCYCIRDKELFSIKEFNKKLISFNFGHLTRDKPGTIQNDDLAVDKPLRQSAAQMIVLSHTLPFLISDWTLNSEDENVCARVDCYILVLQIMNLCLAYEINQESIDLLSHVIEVFLLRFNSLYPDAFVPKFHFLIHVPRYIKLFGPGRQQWCFRFEAAHAYYKSLVSVVRNFKNMPYTMASRQQARMCCQLNVYPGQSSKTFLYDGHKINEGPTVLLKNLHYAQLLDGYIEESERNTYEIMRSPQVTMYGTTYKTGSIVLLECEENDMPSFGEVNDICILRDKILLIVELLETIYYESKLNAYKIVKPTNIERSIILKDVQNLIFPHPISCFKSKDSRFVSLINYERCEFSG